MSDVFDSDDIDRQASPGELARVAAVIKAEPRFGYFGTSLFAVKLLRLDAKLEAGVPMTPRRMGNVLGVAPELLQEYLSHVSSPGAETCELFARVAGVFREGRDVADVSCVIEKGALLTVNDPSSGGIRFVKFVPFKPFASRTGKTDDAETDGETA